MKIKIFTLSIIPLFLSFLLSCTNNFMHNTEKIKPHIPAASIKLLPDSGTIYMVKEDTYTIKAVVLPENAADKKLYYSSNDETVVSVNDEGMMKAHEVGETAIIISGANNIKKAVPVIVAPQPIPVTGITNTSPIPEFLTVGDTFNLQIQIEPAEATNKNYACISEHHTVAWISGKNIIKAAQAGKTNITIRSESNPEIVETFSVTVKEKPHIKIAESHEAFYYGSSMQGSLQCNIQTLYGKLDYTLEIPEHTDWLNLGAVNKTAEDKDIITFNIAENKTPWNRSVYIKFKDNKTGSFIKDGKKELTIKITQAKNSNPPNVTIRWAAGINGPSENEKKRIRYQNETMEAVPYAFTWAETVNTHFFNARKASYIPQDDSYISDSNTCWAKTSTNMLHRWFEQNKTVIEQYKNKIGGTSAYDAAYDRSLPDSKESKKSTIAEVFNKHFPNRGGDLLSGLKWYLYETPLYYPEGLKLFKDVFNKDNTPLEQTSVHSKEKFESIIKNALDSQKTVGLVLKKDNGSFWHAITLWGAAFDAENNIIAIYIADSNDPRNIINTYGIHYQERPKNGNPYILRFDLNHYDKNLYIDTVVTLDKGEKQFEAFFAKYPHN